ncbi:hypothetical protein [Nocardia lijiangensis]|uniref:hypothetical protein n=1 Tax=Nocardia lijiangensis TaxID=299618 RepID=UPI003D750A7E
MTRQLVLIHGRAQERKDSVALKAEWLDALAKGLEKNNLSLPIAEQDVRFPYYGDTLSDLVGGKPDEDAAAVVVRGEDTDDDEKRFIRAMLEEIRVRNGITREQLAAAAGQEAIDKGPANWEWFQAIIRAIDRNVPLGSGAGIALATVDVYQYLRNAAIREKIESGIAQAMKPGIETVVVAHSLGSIVAYKLLRTEGHLRDWNVPLFVTVGSPLAVTEIRKSLKNFATTHCPDCVGRWHNAMDDRDVVALYPLTPQHFPLNPDEPSIENRTDIRNRTTNRHGIAGYLDDPGVAKLIHDALAG